MGSSGATPRRGVLVDLAACMPATLHPLCGGHGEVLASGSDLDSNG